MAANDVLMRSAIEAALAGEWESSHQTVQKFDDGTACWIHAVLHKIEGDASNSRYWYARTDVNYEDYPDPAQELLVIRQQLENE